jgi:hypothetical protein
MYEKPSGSRMSVMILCATISVHYLDIPMSWMLMSEVACCTTCVGDGDLDVSKSAGDVVSIVTWRGGVATLVSGEDVLAGPWRGRISVLVSREGIARGAWATGRGVVSGDGGVLSPDSLSPSEHCHQRVNENTDCF